MRTAFSGLVVAFSGLVVALGLTVWVEERYYGLSTAAIGDFAMHPALMGLAFLLCAPLGAVAFVIGGKQSHAAAKFAHAMLHLAALSIGLLGAYSMYRTHEASRYRFHLQTLHSWLGVGVLAMYFAQFSAGAYLFGFASPAARARFVGAHATCGRYVVTCALLVCILGSLSTVWKPGVAEPHPHAAGIDDWRLQNASGVLMALGMVGLHVLLERRARERASAKLAASPPPSPALAMLSEPLLREEANATGSAAACTATWHLAIHVAIIGSSGLLLGYDLCIIATILTPVQRELQLCPSCAGDGSDAALARCSCTAKQLAVSACHVGAMLGSAFGGAFSDRVGRRVALVVSDLAFMLGSASMAASTVSTLALFFIGRGVVGIAIGAAGAVSSTYLAEIAPARMRGTLVTVNEVLLCAGCLLAYVVTTCVGDAQWRWCVSFAGVLAAVQLAAMLSFIEESPRWVEHVRSRASKGGGGGEATALFDALHRDRGPLMIAAGLAFWHGITGANAVLYYSRDVLELAGIAQPRLVNLGVGVTKFLGALASVVLVDTVGRRTLLFAGSALMSAGHFGLATSFWITSSIGASAHATLALGSLLVFIFAWNLSWAGLMLTVAAEVLPLPIRGVGVGIVYALYWLISFVISQTLESTLAALGEAPTFAIYGSLTAGALCFVCVAVPETNGVALEAVAARRTKNRG